MAGAGIESVTVTDTAIPCPALYAKYLASPNWLNEAEYNLCLVTHNAGQFVLNSGHWIWTEIDSLWNDLWGVVKSSGSTVVGWGRQAGKTVGDGAAAVLKGTRNALDWTTEQLHRIANNLYQEFGSLGTWLLAAAGIAAVIFIAPAINDVASNTRKDRPQRARKLRVGKHISYNNGAAA